MIVNKCITLNLSDMFSIFLLIIPQRMQEKEIDFGYLQQIIVEGIKQIQINAVLKDAVFFLGDTGVGKSTLMTYMLGEQLTVSQMGLKPSLSGPLNSKVKIGHEKYSETSVPNQHLIDHKVFYDCPGFNDNKSQQCDIANSFYLQRLFDLYDRAKVVLVIDESYLTQARSHRLPALINKLSESFGDLENIKSSLLLIINRCNPQFSKEEIKEQFEKLLQTENLPSFSTQNRQFFKYLLAKEQYLMFPAPKRSEFGQKFPQEFRNKIFTAINSLEFVRGIKINNIIAQKTKLAIRDFIDSAVLEIDLIVNGVVQEVERNLNLEGKDNEELYQLKERILDVVQDREIMQNEHQFEKLYELLDDFMGREQQTLKLKNEVKVISFFKGVYNKTSIFFGSLTNAIIKALSIQLMNIDRAIIEAQKKRASTEPEPSDFLRPRKIFDEITNIYDEEQKPLKCSKSDGKVIEKQKKRVTIDESCVTDVSESSIKPVTYESIFNKISTNRLEPYELTPFDESDPIIAFKKKLIECEYMAKQLVFEAQLHHRKMLITGRSLGVPQKQQQQIL